MITSRITQCITRRKIPSGRSIKVLVVDDARLVAESFGLYLSVEKMDCRAAYSGLEAIGMSVSWIPDVIIMDVMMPICTGFDAAGAIRAAARTSEVIIIVFTVLDEAQIRRKTGTSHFDAYCPKGQPPDQLLTVIHQFFKIE